MKMNTSMINTQERGFSLVEVLVAAFLLAICLLGVASLQLKSLQVSYESRLRSEAVVLVQDLIDRMVLNRSADYTTEELLPEDTPNDDCFESVCTSLQLKDFDLANWQFQLWRSFPGAIARIEEIVIEGQDAARVTIAWREVATWQSGLEVADEVDVEDATRSVVLVSVM